MYSDRNFRNHERGPRNVKGRFPLTELLIAMLIVTAIFAVIWTSAFLHNDGRKNDTTDTAGDVNTASDAETDAKDMGEDLKKEISLLCAGDVMYHSPQIESAYNSLDGSYDFSSSYRYIKDIVSSADYAVVNFETTLAGPDYTYTGWPTFNSPDSGFTALIDAGFDMMLFANNHCYDNKHVGLIRTQEVFNAEGIDYIGARLNTTDKTYRTVDVEGIRIGMLNSTSDIAYGNLTPRTVNGITVDDGDLELMDIYNDSLLEEFYAQTASRIAELRADGAELIIYFMHWGDEYSIRHNDTQSAIAQRLCNLGVDVIIGGHPHVIQDAEILTSEEDPTHTTLCFYSLGNLVSNQNRLTLGDTVNKEYTENGLFVRLNISRDSDGVCTVSGVDTIPLWVHRYYSSQENRTCYDIIPLEEALKNPSSFGLYNSSFGETNASEAYRMTNATLGGICEAFAEIASSKQ